MTAQKPEPQPTAGQSKSTPSSSTTTRVSGGGTAALQLKASLRGLDYDTQVQMLTPDGGTDGGTSSVHQAAARGISGGGGKLPDADKIQKSFGGYDISNIQAHLGGSANEANQAMGANAYASGNHVVLGENGKDLRTQAHEATHVVQQDAGVSLSGGVGQAGDRYEKHADDVADAVVAGKSAEDLLGQMAGQQNNSSRHQEYAIQHSLGDPVPFAELEMTQVGGASETCDDPRLARSAVKDIIATRLADAVHKYIRSIAQTEALAMNRFIHATGGAPGISLAQSGFFALVGESVLGEAVEFVAEKSFTIAGFLKSEPAKIFFGITTGVAWSVLSTFITSNDGEESHEALKKAGALAGDALTQVFASADTAAAQWSGFQAQLYAELDDSQDSAWMNSVETWVDAQLPRLNVRPNDASVMYRALLERWMLERSAGPTEAGKGINPASHKEAIAELGPKDDTTLNTKELGHAEQSANSDGQRITKQKLFLDQMRYALSKQGVDPAPAISFFEERFDTFTKLVNEGDSIWRGNPQNISRRMARQVFNLSKTLEPDRWTALHTSKSRHGGGPLAPPGQKASVGLRLELDWDDGVFSLDGLWATYKFEGDANTRAFEAREWRWH